MGNDVSKVLCNVAVEMLEGLAFLFALPVEKMEDSEADSLLTAKISFSGAFSGTLVALVSRQMLPELAGNMLGIEMDEDVSIEEQHDALKELLNVICGNLLPAVGGKEEVFSVQVPEIVDREAMAHFTEGRTVSGAARLELDGSYLNLMLYCEGSLPAPNAG